MKLRSRVPHEGLRREKIEARFPGQRFVLTRKYPIGAEVVPGGGTHFRVWAPKSQRVAVQFSVTAQVLDEEVDEVELEPEEGGYFSMYVAAAKPGTHYRFRLEDGCFPDPASRFQPAGPHGPSQVVDPALFPWADRAWRGVKRQGQVLYEMHIGTFTPHGTWVAAKGELAELARLGVTVVELMPVAEFPGHFGWGYDGVDLFAPTHLYGSPDEFRAFVNEAHSCGLGVILDVVYNHLGPDGNYLKHFSEDYFTDRYRNEWGEPLNFDGPNSQSVREFYVTNASYWIEEFHLDGLRLDATQQIFDSSAEHIVAGISRATRRAAKGREVYLVGENESQEARLAQPAEQGGYGLDALWNDDFHHSATVALTGHNAAYYTDYRGTPQEFVSAAKHGFLYQGQWYCWQKKARGAPAGGLAPEQFITYLQNHDQVANSLRGERGQQLSGPGPLRALTALLLLGPGTPMLFQGQEFGASAPFLYFADHHPELAQLVSVGRREFLNQFPAIAAAASSVGLDEPAAAETFQRCKLDFGERQRHREVYALHQDLLKLRREDPVFSQPRRGRVDGAVLGAEAFVLRFFGEAGADRLLLLNLGMDLPLAPMPEPLLAPPEGRRWALKWSSEEPRYGGNGQPPLETEGNWMLLGRAALVLEAERNGCVGPA